MRALRGRAQECFLNFSACVHRLEHDHMSATPYCILSSEQMISFYTSGVTSKSFYPLQEPLLRNLYGW